MSRALLCALLCSWLFACACTSREPVAEQPSTRAATGQASAEVRDHAGLKAADLRAQHARPRAQSLAYDARAAVGLSTIQASTHALSERELRRLSEQGFVVSASQEFPTMLYGYASLYVQDLPVFVTADSILDSVFRSYDAMLEQIERDVLVQDLGLLLRGLRAALARAADGGEATAQVDLMLAVAQGLLQMDDVQGVAGADPAAVARLTQLARRASGHERITLFGSERDFDFSQLEPRGHYANSPELARYFKALSWISRVDLRLLETTPEGERVLRRQQLEASLLLRELMDGELLELYRRIDDVLQAFAGRSDALGLRELDTLCARLGLARPDQVALADADALTAVILEGGFGEQRIAGQLLQNRSSDGRPLPLSRVFALFGQRYAVDSHVLSNVVHDVVPGRMMPNPLDAAFAAFGNDAALERIGPELDQYAAALASTRQLVEMQDPGYWDEGLNTTWLKALRALSRPPADGALPEVARTAAWDARILNTQLGSWAQLRRATALYTKPSYTVGLLCEYPDAYVEPYPAFFAALSDLADRGLALATLISARDEALGARLGAYFTNLAQAMTTLREMAELELSARPFTADHLAFINDAVRQRDACPGTGSFDGWYARLDFSRDDTTMRSQVEPVVADIHTQPTDLAGRDVGRILHIGVGLPRLMVVSTPTCEGPRAYAGLVFSYHELITDGWQRLDDGQWSDRVLGVSGEPLPDVDWARSFVVSETAP